MKKLFLFFIISIIIGSPVFCDAAKWTIMVYMAGDNNLAQSALGDIEEMKNVGSTPEVNIVVQVDLSSIYVPNSDGITKRYYIKRGEVQEYSLNTNIDSADPNMLTNFIKWAKKYFPANHYLLVLWNHGAGWKMVSKSVKGILEDETSNRIMSIDQVANAIRASGIHFDVIDMDACLMGMYEVAYTFRNVADYLVFSESTEPSDGDPYDVFLSTIVQNPNINSRTLAYNIVESYYNFYMQNEVDIGITKSACDLSYINQLHNLITNFVSITKPNISEFTYGLETAASQAQSYEYPTYKDLYDFFTILRNYIDNPQIQQLINNILHLVDQMIINNRVYDPGANASASYFDIPSVSNSHGISIYFPSFSEATNEELSEYSGLSMNQGQDSWYELIITFLNSGSTTPETPPVVPGARGNFLWAILWVDQWFNFPAAADVDLFMVQPCPNCEDGWDIFAPYMGMSTPNGNFSPDSLDTGLSYEAFMANDSIYPGSYTAVAHLNCDTDFYYNYAYTYFLIKDPNLGLFDWTIVDERELTCDFSAPSPEYWDENIIIKIINGDYSNWWVIHTEEKKLTHKFKYNISHKVHDVLGRGN